MDDVRHRRPSTPPRIEPPYRRNSSESRRFDDGRMEDARRAEDQRRVEEMRRADVMDEILHRGRAILHRRRALRLHWWQMSGHRVRLGMMRGLGRTIAVIGVTLLGPGPQPGPVPKEYPPAPEERRMEHPSSRPPIISLERTSRRALPCATSQIWAY
ncbi:hypothetical protein B0T26DRAFT_538108 [Lasiosphaeria miniovina]|uniref:Uncharacterized protein n=1 Tax=Lasiosphaeria miniovina TaxID=1954250 RepID=A0AA40DGA4_9PEZI|nr:uncharacterized protein B0T26DRAFT_538108 [Lasiosphaeria miniovina]KAK0701990.1 hypothetical protein B0T26DRAFT_538108 [Lasiosphaeria miniovina]